MPTSRQELSRWARRTPAAWVARGRVQFVAEKEVLCDDTHPADARELVRRNYAETTIRTYLRSVEQFREYARKRLDHLGPDDMRRYQAYLLENKKLAVGTVVLHISALRFLYVRGDRGQEAVKQSDFRQGWNLSRGGAVPWGCVGRPSVLPFEFRRRSGEPAGARFSPWRGLAGAFRLAPYAGSGANSNRRCRLNVSAAHAASQLTFSSPRVANRRSFNFVLIQALGNSASGARCL